MTRTQAFRAQICDALGHALDVEGVVIFCALEANYSIERIASELRIRPVVISKAIDVAAAVQLRRAKEPLTRPGV